MGILTSFEKQAFIVENGNSTKWESCPQNLVPEQNGNLSKHSENVISPLTNAVFEKNSNFLRKL